MTQNTGGTSTTNALSSVGTPIIDFQSLLSNAEKATERAAQSAEAAKVAELHAMTSQTSIAALHLEIEAKNTDIDVVRTSVMAARDQINVSTSAIETSVESVKQFATQIETIHNDLNHILSIAKQCNIENESQQARAQNAADAATGLLLAIRADKDVTTVHGGEIKTARDSAVDASSKLVALAAKAENVEEIIAAHEARLAELKTQCAEQLASISALLPGATSAGLAHAFDARGKTFLKPGARWQISFVVSLLLLVALSISGILQIYKSDHILSYDELLRLWLTRLPVAGALLWLALHSSRESALAKRLEEDYGYKSVIASSFLGFHEQMLKIGTVPHDAPIAQLCINTLATIANPPGRIYDKHNLTVSPTTELKDTVEILTGQSKLKNE